MHSEIKIVDITKYPSHNISIIFQVKLDLNK
jgi:hypothetical protein